MLWKYPYKITYGVSIATPIFHNGTVLVCGYWHGSRAIKLGRSPTKPICSGKKTATSAA